MQVGLHSEMGVIQTNGSRTWISFIWILSPQSFVSVTVVTLPIIVSVASLSLASQRHTYIQYNPTNLNPLGEYELG